MITSLQLENFKAFGKRTHIELAPITLIFGENSAGKSSILQALNLLKQTRENRDSGALLLPRIEGGIVELGGFKELIFDHELDRKLSIRLDFEVEKNSRSGLKRKNDANVETTGYEVVFSRPSLKREVQLEKIVLHSSGTNEPIAEFQPVDVNAPDVNRVIKDSRPMWRSFQAPRLANMRAAKCVSVTTDPEIWREYYDRIKRRSEQMIQELKQLKSDIENSDGQRSLFKELEEDGQNRINEAIEFYSADFQLEQFIDRLLSAELETIIGLDGFIPLPTRQRGKVKLAELETARRYGPARLRMRELSLDINSYAAYQGRQLDLLFESIYPMGPFRRPPERWYIFSGSSPLDVGYHGELLPDLLFRRPEVVEEANKWLDKLEIGYHLKVQSASERSSDLFEVRLVDRRREKEVDVALSDVGFGISQILPFIVQSLAGERQVITIEQPEVHIHPRLQADLGDLLAHCVGESHKHKYVIETHSEHLVLRMQKLIRNGDLTPDDVSILFVSRGEEGSNVQRLRLDEEGDFIDDWPGGFFPERLRELS